jgi:hypothetical protein
VPVRAYDPDSGHSLNNTFKVLNKYALIDRTNEHNDSTNSSEPSLEDKLGQYVDVFRIHCVIQDFAYDTMLSTGELATWLIRSAAVFCASYNNAEERVKLKSQTGILEDYRLYETHCLRILEHVKRNERRGGSLAESRFNLEKALEKIREEISKRNLESSGESLGADPGTSLTSIFDRTSSSSDAGTEPPPRVDRYPSIAAWEINAAILSRSPMSINHEASATSNTGSIPNSAFPPLSTEDPGYTTDHNDLAPSTYAQQLRGSRQGQYDPSAARGIASNQPRSSRLDLHRAVKNREGNKYRDAAGAWRSTTTDPRVNPEYVQGHMDATPRAPSRGRMSGRSQAEAALTSISKVSPPPARGGGMIQDRGHSGSRSRLGATATYASAVSGDTRSNATGNHKARDDSRPNRKVRPAPITSPAMRSLQKIPTLSSSSPLSAKPEPAVAQPVAEDFYHQPYPNSDPEVSQMSSYNDQSDFEDDHYKSPVIYGRKSEALAVERIGYGDSQEGEQDESYECPPWNTQAYAESRATMNESRAAMKSPGSPQNESYNQWRPQIRDSPYKTYSENGYSHDKEQYSDEAAQGSYNSQPMSRNVSTQSDSSSHPPRRRPIRLDSYRATRSRRASLTATDQPPKPVDMSPIMPPGSYPSYRAQAGTPSRQPYASQDWSRMSRSEHHLPSNNAQGRGRGNSPLRRSPRLGFARAALIERLDEWGVSNSPYPQVQPPAPPPPSRSQSPFTPSVASFQQRPPTRNSGYSNPVQPYPAKGYHAPNRQTHHSDDQVPGFYPVPLPARYLSEIIPNAQSPGMPPRPSTGQGMHAERQEVPDMARTGSGGIKIVGGNRYIDYGDFPEPVDWDISRDRAERGGMTDRRAYDDNSFRDNSQSYSRREMRPGRDIMREEERSRRRGLSSPESFVREA